ncbi:unnamed protein product, partial [Prorocentrum cordatum]
MEVDEGVAHNGIVELWIDPGKKHHYLKNQLTHETVKILAPPAGTDYWVIDLKDNYAYIDSPDESHWVTEFFKHNAFVSDQGQTFVKSTDSDSPEWIENFLGMHRVDEFAFAHPAGTQTTRYMMVAVWENAQYDSSVWISLWSVFDMLCLHVNVSGGSWFANRRDAWERCLCAWQLRHHLRQSSPYANKRAALSSEELAMRILKFPSVSVVGMMCLMIQWGSENQSSRFKSDTDRASANDLFDSFAYMIQNGSIRVNVDGFAWRCGPDIAGVRPMVVLIKAGRFERKSFNAVVESFFNEYGTPVSWEDAGVWDKREEGEDFKPSDVIQKILTGNRDAKLAMQLVWGLGNLVDAKIAKAKGKDVELAPDFRYDFSDDLDAQPDSSVDVAVSGNHGAAQVIMRYLKVSKRTMIDSMNLGFVMDASTPDHQKKFYGAVFKPNNTVAICPPQVSSVYSGRQMYDSESTALAVQTYENTHIERARELLGIKCNSSELPRMEKVKRRYRLDSFMAGKALHNMRLVSVGEGLGAVKITLEQYHQMKDCYDWKCDHLCSDQGPDMKCLKWFLQSSEGLFNVDDDDDLAHGIDNDFNIADKKCGLWAFRRLQRLARNAIYGPFDEGRRFKELKDIAKEVKTFVSPLKCPIFCEALPAILEEMGEPARIMENGIEEEVWNGMTEVGFGEVAGRKDNPARWLGDHYASRIDRDQFTMRAVCFPYAVIVREQSSTKKLGVKMKELHSEPNQHGGNDQAVSMKSVAAELKRVRMATRDQVEVAIVYYNNKQNKNIDRATFAIREPWAQWHSHNNWHLRDLTNVTDWEVDQIVNGKLLKVFVESMSVPFDGKGMMAYLGFAVDHSHVNVNEVSASHPLLKIEGDMAELIGTYSLVLNACRFKRLFKLMRGWPKHLVAALGDLASQDRVFALFKQDYENWKALGDDTVGFRALSGIMARLKKSSPFNLVPVRQHLGILIESGFQRTSRYMEFLSENRTRPLLSQIAEDCFCRSAKDIQHALGQDRGIDRDFANLIVKDVVSKVHRHKDINWKFEPLVRNPRIPKEVYQNTPDDVKAIGLQNIIGPNQSPKWSNQSVANDSKPTFEMDMLEFCRANGVNVSTAEKHWYCALAKQGKVAIKMKGSPDSDYGIVMGDMCGIGVLTAKLKPFKYRSGRDFYMIDFDAAAPLKMTYVFDPSEWDALPLSWTSPLMQFVAEGGRSLPGGVEKYCMRLEPTGPADSLLRVAAKNAFWDLGLSVLKTFHKDLCVDPPGGLDLFETLQALVTRVLKPTDLDLCEILRKRCFVKFVGEDGLVDIQGAMDCMTKEEQEMTRETLSEKDAQKQIRKEYTAKFNVYRKEVKAVRTAEAADQNRTKQELKKWKGPIEPPKDGIVHSEAKKFLPPGASLWRGLTGTGAWHVHIPPHYKSKTWLEAGSYDNALRFVLAFAWKKYLKSKDLDDSHCPIKGLLKHYADEEEQ